MFRIKLTPANKNAKPLRTIEREMEMTREKYNNYLKNTSMNYQAQRSNVTVKDPHTMAGHSYWPLRNNIDTLNISAKKANKDVTFEDARALTRDDEFISPIIEEKFGEKILISVKDKVTGQKEQQCVDVFKNPETSLMKKVSNALGEMFTGKKGANIDSELGLK